METRILVMLDICYTFIGFVHRPFALRSCFPYLHLFKYFFHELIIMKNRLLSTSFKVRDKFVIPNSSTIQWYPGHMKRGVDKIQSSLHQIDAVIEVHDARIPFSGRNSQLKDVIHIRPHILLLNKCDMTDMSRKDEIVKKLKDEGFSNVYFSNFTSKHILKKVRNDIIPMLMKEIENRPRFRSDVMNRYNIMVLGIPNVGKSTLLNKLLEAYTTKRSVATVGALPGVTRSVMNKVKVNFDPETYVVDTPGILNPKITNVDVGMRLALCDCIPNHLIGKDVIVDYLLYWLNKHEMFSYVKHYSLSEPTDNVNKLLSEVALRNKFVVPVKDKSLEQKYRLNFEKACSHVIKDFQHGKFGKIMLDDDLLD